ncbi:MAG: T9SS type A sorting domain-containing protein [Bacteroidales bacterium]|nr:T9SS type A sorting domain-containing protein [Bacteroidales bacterium]
MRRSFILICVALLFSMFANAQSYTITATAGENGTITPSGEVSVAEGENQAFTIEASTSYRIASVLVDDVEAKDELVDGVYTFVNVTANHTIAATFEEIPAPTYTITLTVGEHGTVSYNDELVATSVTVNESSTPAFTFNPETGYRVESVILDGETNVTNDLVGNVYTFAAITANHSLAVTFGEIPATTYTITVTAGANGTIAPSGEVTVEEGENAEFTITPAEGYRIAAVIVDAETENETNVTENVVAGDGVFFYTLVNVTANHTINVTFAEIPTYTITVEAGENGYVYYNDALVSAPIVVTEGATPEFEITPATGYQIDALTVGENTIDLTAQQLGGFTYTFPPVMANITLAVTFEEIPATTYTITATAGENGTITPSGEVTVEEGEDMEFTISANEGFRIASVMVDATTDVTSQLVEGVYTFTAVDANHTIAATFEEDNDTPEPTMFGITFVGLEEGNNITVPENARVDSVAPGENYVFGITLTSCQGAIASVTVGEDVVLTANEGFYTVENVQSDITITVVFAKYYYIVTATAGEHGAVAEGFASNSVECGTDYAITFVPDEGYKLDKVMLDEEEVTEGISGNTYTLTNVIAEHSVAATFVELQDVPGDTMFGVTFAGLNENDSIVIPVNVDSLYVHEAAVIDSVQSGSDFVFGFMLAECHQIDKVMVNDVELVANEEGYYTLANVVNDTTITVSYLEVKYTLSISAGEHGSVAVAEAEVDCGDAYTVTFVPESGYRLASVLLDGEAVTEGVSGNNYTLTVYANHTIQGEFAEFRGPYVEYVNLTAEHAVGDTIDFSLKMHSNCMLENLCGVGYELLYWNTDTTSIVVTDATRYGVFSYNVNVTDDESFTNAITNGSGMLNYVLEQDDATYNVGAFTLGLFDEVAGRDRNIDYSMMFTTSGRYQLKTTLYTCANGGDALGSEYVASECDDLTHYDRVAETCSNPRSVYELVGDINITGATIHTITTTVIGEHGTVEPEGTIIVEAGTRHEIRFIPDEYYALDTVMVNGIMRYPTISQVQYVIDSVYTIDSITENYNITVKFKDVRPYYNVHVEVMTAGGTVTPKDTTVVIGSDVTLTITPNSGYHISQLDVDGNLIANYASNEIIFRNIHEDHNVTISFFPNSIEDEAFANLSIYPNPNNGQFTVSSDDFEGNVTFQIYSVSGSMMDEKTINGEKNVSFDKSLPAGTYFMRIIAGDKVATRKIVVE